MADYFIVKEGQASGPFALADLPLHGLAPHTLVWTEGMADWAPATAVPAVEALLPKPEPPPIPAPMPPPVAPPHVAAPQPPPIVRHVLTPDEPATEPAPRRAMQNPAPKMQQQVAPHAPNLPQTSEERYGQAKSTAGMGSRRTWIVIGVVVALLLTFILVLNLMSSRARSAEEIRNEDVARQVAQKQRQLALQDSLARIESARNAREAAHADSLANINRQKEYAANKIYDLVTASVNGNVGVDEVLGGLSGIVVTFKNESEYVMDDVYADVQYLKGNGDVLQTKRVHVAKLQPKSSKTAEAPDSDRGKEVKAKVVGLVSRALELNKQPASVQ